MNPTPPSTVSPVTPTIFAAWWVVGMVVLAAAVSWTLGRLLDLPGLHRFRRWLALGRVLLWSFVAFDVVFALGHAVTEHWLVLGVVVVAIAALAGLDWLRNVVAGLALAFEDRFRPGDLVRHRDVEGELVHFGTRAVTLRSREGTLHHVPNQRFVRESLTHLETEGKAACDILVALPRGVSPDRALRLAEQAAFLTPLASPHHRPQAFLDVDADDGDTGVRLHIRGYPFDPAYRDHYRSDVVARVHSLLRTERAIESTSR